MSNDHIDDRIAQYYALYGRAQRLAASRGKVRPRQCAECRRQKRKAKPDGSIVCAAKKCGAPWPEPVEAVVAKGRVQVAPRPGAYGNRLAEFASLGYALNKMLRDKEHWRWPAQMLVAYCTRTSDYRRLAAYADPDSGPWTPESAESAVDAARDELLRRLAESRSRKRRPTLAANKPAIARAESGSYVVTLADGSSQRFDTWAAAKAARDDAVRAWGRFYQVTALQGPDGLVRLRVAAHNGARPGERVLARGPVESRGAAKRRAARVKAGAREVVPGRLSPRSLPAAMAREHLEFGPQVTKARREGLKLAPPDSPESSPTSAPILPPGADSVVINMGERSVATSPSPSGARTAPPFFRPARRRGPHAQEE